MPVAADVGDLVRLLQHLGDHRIAGDRAEETVHVDRRPALGEGDVLFGSEALAAEEDDAEVCERLLDLGELRIARWLGQVDAMDLGAEVGRASMASKLGASAGPPAPATSVVI